MENPRSSSFRSTQSKLQVSLKIFAATSQTLRFNTKPPLKSDHVSFSGARRFQAQQQVLMSGENVSWSRFSIIIAVVLVGDNSRALLIEKF